MIEHLARAVCGKCLRTFLSALPLEEQFCWECGQKLIYILGDDVSTKKEIKDESNL